MLLIPLLVVSHAISLENVIQQHFEQNESNRSFRDQLTLDSTQYECRNLGIKDSTLKLQGNGNTNIVFDERTIHSNRFSALLCISNSSVELDRLQLDASNNHPNTSHRPYSSGYAGQSISVLSICSSSIVVSNSEIRVPPQQSPFVIAGSENVGEDETTHLSVQNSSLFSSSSISGATTLILPSARHLGLCISMMSCTLDSTQIGSDTGLLVQVANSPRSNKNCGRIETFMSGNRIENVTRTSSDHFNPSDQGIWSQRLISNSIANSTSVLCGSIIRDMNLGGDFLSTNTSFVSCSTSSVQPLTGRELGRQIYIPYLGPNLRQDKSDDGAYEWEGKDFVKGTLFHFFDFDSEGEAYFAEGSRFLYSSISHTIRFTSCTFTDIDGKDTDDEYRDTDGAAIIIRCPSSLVVEDCQFSNCGGELDGGAIDIAFELEHMTASIVSSSFEECWTTSGESSVLHHRSRGLVTLTSSNFTNYPTEDHNQLIYSEGIVVSNCQFKYNGSIYQAREMKYLGLSPLTIEIFDGEQTVDPGNLQTALTDTDITLFYLGEGNYGTFEIEARSIQLKKWNSEDNLYPTEPAITSFSIAVKAEATCSISVFQLAPLDKSSSIISVFTLGTCSLDSVVVDQIDGLIVPLFSVTGADAEFYLKHCQFTNIRNAEANLIQATENFRIELTSTIITQISTTQSVISVQDCYTVRLAGSTITHVHRTEGEGPAAVEVFRSENVYLDELTVRNCVSDEGNVGGIHLITTPDNYHNFELICMSNTAPQDKPTHILVEGLNEEQTHALLQQSNLLGTPTHFGWVNEDGYGTSFGVVDTSRLYFTLTSSTVIQSPHHLAIEGMHPLDFHLDEIFANQPLGRRVIVTCHLPFDVPLVQKPVTFTDNRLEWESEQGAGFFPNVLLQQDPTTLEESLFTLQTSSEIELRSITFQLDSLTSSPLVKVDASSTLILSESVVFGGAGQFHRPFLETSGEITIHECQFYGLSFNGHSCIKMSGGYFGFEGDTEPVQISSVVNVSTTGKGAFLSSSKARDVEIRLVQFINCSAEAGGAIFVEDAAEFELSSSFHTCTARTTGGAMMIVNNIGTGKFYFHSSFINCRAQRGGGLFLSLAEGTYFDLGESDYLSIFGRDYSHADFENCVAEKGAGVYFEGTMKGDDFDFDAPSFNNWNTQGLGTDIFFAKNVPFDDLSSKKELFKDSLFSTSRQSTDLSKQCQVYFESSPSHSFDLPLPKFKLNGSRTDVASPLTASELHSFREITPYFHVMDDRGKLMKMTVSVGSEFCIFERGFCSSQHISFVKDTEEPEVSSVVVQRDEDAPLYDLVALELDADAVIEFHNLIFAIECPFQMMLVKHRSARGLFETCELLFETGMELPLALFEVEDGTLSLTQILISVKGDEGTFTVNDFVLTHAPLILVAPTDSATSSPNVILDHVTLRRMRLKEDVVSLMLFDFSASVEVNEVEFIDCNQTDSTEAKRIIATGSNLERVVEKWNGFETLSDPADPLSWVIDNAESAESIWHTIPLRVAFVRFEGQTITVEKTGKDVAGCGEGSWNCRGLARAGKNVGGNQPCTIAIVESSFLNGVFDPPAKRTSVESSSSKSVIDVWKEGRMVNSPDGGQAPILTLSHLSFSLPPALDTDSLIQSLGGEVTVKDCWFVSSSPISFHLLSATSGVVDIDKIVISELKFSSTLINLVGLDSATIESLTLTDLGLSDRH